MNNFSLQNRNMYIVEVNENEMKRIQHYCSNNAIVEAKELVLSSCRAKDVPSNDVIMFVLAFVLSP